MNNFDSVSFSTTKDYEEITLDDKFNDPKAYSSSPSSSTAALSASDKRSPCGRGKTMRDFEEELSELKRVNFDLKMRIYMMEEQQDLFQGVDNIDEIYQINSSLKKEVETLKKEISDKDDLILKAGDAMNLLVHKHKEEIGIIRIQAQEEVENLKEKLDILQQELIDVREKSTFFRPHNSILDESSMMFALPYTLPMEKSAFDLTKNEGEIIIGLSSKLSELTAELKEKNLQLEELRKTAEKLNEENITLKETENNLRSEIVAKGGQICVLQGDLGERDIDIQALHKQINLYELQSNNDIEVRNENVQGESDLLEEIQKLQIASSQQATNYQQLKMWYDVTKLENDQLSNQIVELHKRINDLQVELQSKGATNMDLHQQLELLRCRNTNEEEQARMLKVINDSDMECSRINNNQTRTTKKSTEITTQLQDVLRKLSEKETELKEAKSEQFSSILLIQKLMKQNKTLTKDVENMKVLLEKKERLHNTNNNNPNSGGNAANSVENVKSELYKTKYEDIVTKLDDVEKERDMLQVIMEQQIQKLLSSLKEKELMIQGYKNEEQHSSDKEGRIEDLMKQVANLKVELQGCASSVSSAEFNTEDVEKIKLNEELDEKKKEIDHLNEELRKRTFNLQELVNKELWDKNREIEKLNKVCEKKQIEAMTLKNQMQRQEEELDVLNGKLQELSEHISQNINKMSERKEEPSFREKYLAEVEGKGAVIKEVEDLKVKLNIEIKKNEDLMNECKHWKEEAELYDKSRKELFNACTSLMTRLEELATFLDSLLPLLGAKKRRMLQQVIDRSREASRSLSMSFLDQSGMANLSNISSVPILPDFSQVDFCSEDDTLEITLVQKDDDREGDKNEADQVAQIREQVESMVEKLKEARLSPEKRHENTKCVSIWTMKSPTVNRSMSVSKLQMDSISLEDITEGSLLESFESDIKDDELDNTALKTIDGRLSNPGGSMTTGGGDKVMDKSSVIGSESEAWSEPDRNVSMARIGIREEMTAALASSDESSDCVPKPSVPSSNKKRHEEIRRLNLKVKHLEKLNASLLGELRHREKIVSPVKSATTTEIQIDSLVTKTLLDEIKKQREKLQASLHHNEFIRNQLEGALTCSIGEVEGKKNLVSQLREMSIELERSCSLCLELERRCISLESERATLREAADNLRAEAAALKANLKEKENEALETQCSLLDLRNKHLMLESTMNTAQNRAEEATARALLLEGKISEIEITLKEAQDGWSKAAATWELEKQNLKEAHAKEITDLQSNSIKMKSDYEKANYEQRTSLERLHKKLEEILLKRSLADSEWKQRLDTLEKEKKKELDDEIERRLDLERKLIVSYEKQSELRSRLETEMSKSREIETSHKTLERWWRRRLEEADGARAEREAELRRRLDAAALTTSEAVLDRTRLANDRLRLQAELRRRDDLAHDVKIELERRVAELEAANKELEIKMSSLHHGLHICSDTEIQCPSSPKSPTPVLLNRQRSNPTSDYTSDPDQHGSNGNLWFPVCGRSNNNASPDLGIESDQGRLSSLDALPPTSPKTTTTPHIGDIGKLELENSELRGQLQRTRKALEETFAQLNAANQKKRQVERAICKQLSKTHYILQKARTNLESSDHRATAQL